MGQLVALVLGFLDFVGFFPGRVLGGEHVLEQPRAALQLVGQRLEVGEELFFAGISRKFMERRIVADRSPSPCYGDVTCGSPAVYALRSACP